MRVISYELKLDEDRKPALIKEDSRNLPCMDVLREPASVQLLLRSIYDADNLAEEHVWLLALDSKCRLIGVFEISHGTVDSSCLSTREIFVRLCLCGAKSFILAHNHPSGVPFPSKEDTKVTKTVREAGRLMNIPLSDHIIVGLEGYYSFYENGQLDS